MDTKKCPCGKETMKDDPQCVVCAVKSWVKKDRTKLLKRSAQIDTEEIVNEQLSMF